MYSSFKAFPWLAFCPGNLLKERIQPLRRVPPVIARKWARCSKLTPVYYSTDICMSSVLQFTVKSTRNGRNKAQKLSGALT